MPPALNSHMFPSGSGPFRVLIFAIAGGAAVLAGFVYVPPLLRPGISVSRFQQLPRAVALDLSFRGCNIVPGKNVISGDFDGTGERGWAVLCQRDNQASLFIYLEGSSKPAIFDTHAAGLVDDAESARGIRTVDWGYVARHNPGIRPAPAPTACIEDGVGMASTVHCHLNGSWVRFAGAD